LPADESGGLDPTVLYGSTMTGFSWQVTDRLGDDVDALTAWYEDIPRPCNPLDVRSLRTHTTVGELSLNMGIKDGIEPRQGGIDKLEIDLDDASGFLGGVVVNCVPTPWVGALATSTSGNTVTVQFNPALPDQTYCEIVLDCGALVCVRSCEGDLNRSGSTTTSDALQCKIRFGQTASNANCEWDFNLSGTITTADALATKIRFGFSAPLCP
jgi:hypothetical protein